MMSRDEFEALVADEFLDAIPEKFRELLHNVAFIVEDEPSLKLRAEEGLSPNETLLGHYRGVPRTERGDVYGVGATLPDIITLFQLPIEEEARETALEGTHETWQQQKAPEEKAPSRSAKSNPPPELFAAATRKVIRETIWHEVAHHFGMDEHTVRQKESERENEL